jgi:MoxR-like ATPase
MNVDPQDLIQAVRSEINKVIIGQREMTDLMLMTLLSKGHILLEGVPGLAKSLAVETFANVIGGKFKRFQFTPDKMPGDITGSTVFNEKEKAFVFHPGPVFCNIFLADEINRASPKVQSALLQAMQERTVDADGTSSLSNKKSMKPSASARRSWIIFSICALPPVRAGISGRNSSLTSD